MVYRQNIGLVVAWWRSSVAGAFCGPCRRRFFWSMTGVTAVLGWWGILSFFVSITVLVGNVARHLGAGRGDRAPRGAPCWRCGTAGLRRLPMPGALQVAVVAALAFAAGAVALAVAGRPWVAPVLGVPAALTLTGAGMLLARPVAVCDACGNRQPA